MKKTVALLLVLVSAIAMFAGCGVPEKADEPTTPGETAETKALSQKVTWLCARPEDGAIVQTIKKLADDFGKDNAGFELDIQVTADRPSYLTKLRTLVSSGEMPEFIDTDADPFAQELVDAGLLVDMKAFLDEQGLYDSFQLPALKYQELPDGSLYLLPLEYHLEMTWYNKEIFEANGLTEPKTIDEYLNVCRTLDAVGITPMSVDGVDVWPVLRYVAMLPFRETGNAYIRGLSQGRKKMDSPTGLATANFVTEIGGYFQEGFASTDYTTAKNMFLNGDVAMYRMGTWEIPTFIEENLPENLKGKVGYFYLPMIDNASTAENEFFGNSGIGMGANAEKFDGIAKDFLVYVINNYAAEYVKTQQMSPIKVEIEDTSIFSDLYLSIKADADAYGEEFAKPWDTLLDPDTNTVMGDQIIKLATGQVTSEQFVATMDEIIAANVQQ